MTFGMQVPFSETFCGSAFQRYDVERVAMVTIK